MRRIIVDKFVMHIAYEYLDKIKSLKVGKVSNKKTLKHKIIDDLSQFRNSIVLPGQERFVYYLDMIINNFDVLITLFPLPKAGNFTNSLSLSQVKGSVMVYGDSDVSIIVEKDFSKELVKALNYDIIRNCVYPEFITELGIKTCVYCNAQYAVTLKKDKEYHNSYTIDHFLNKDEFPCYAISFFNLIPSCDQCNRFKSTKNAFFYLYASSLEKEDVFYFQLENGSKGKYLISWNEEDLEIGLHSTIQNLKKNHENIFHIEKKYLSHRDEVAILLKKKQFYNPTYINQLNNQFKSMFPLSKLDFDKFLWGYDLSPDRVHSKPLALLIQSLI